MRLIASTLSAWALALSLAVVPQIGLASGRSGASTATASTSANVSIDNFGKVNETYYRGAQPRGRDYADLAVLGIKTVIDLQADGIATEHQLVAAAGMKYFRSPMTTRIAPTRAELDRFMQLVNDPANQPVYVHCAGGRHRTGVMTAVYRMTADKWTADQAFSEMKRYKFGADFLHPEFKQFVYSYRLAVE